LSMVSVPDAASGSPQSKCGIILTLTPQR
jgi:hypothetical protein